MAWTTPRTYVSGELVTAAMLNTDHRDNLNAITTWTSYTPTWSSSGTAPTLGNGTLIGKYISAGKRVLFSIVLTYGSTSTPGTGAWTFTVPVTAVNVTHIMAFPSILTDSGTAHHLAMGYLASTTAISIVQDGNVGSGIGAGVPFTWATSDRVVVNGEYEAA